MTLIALAFLLHAPFHPATLPEYQSWLRMDYATEAVTFCMMVEGNREAKEDGKPNPYWLPMGLSRQAADRLTTCALRNGYRDAGDMLTWLGYARDYWGAWVKGEKYWNVQKG